MSWRQTGSCSADGPREPDKDLFLKFGVGRGGRTLNPAGGGGGVGVVGFTMFAVFLVGEGEVGLGQSLNS